MLLFGAFNSPGTDYDNAIVSEHTEEASLEALSTVNMILGFIHDSRADQFINKGNYKALLKSNENGGGASSGSGVTTTVEKLKPMILNVTRDTNTSATANPPMVIKFWMDESDGPNNTSMRVVGYINVTHGVDAVYPVGQLRMDFKGYPINPDGTTNTSVVYMKGAMILDKATGTDAASGRADVKFLEYDNDGQGGWNPTILNMTYDVSVDTNGDGVVDGNDTQGNGVAYTRTQDWSLNNGSMASYEIAFTKDDYKIQKIDVTSQGNRTDPATGNQINSYQIDTGSPEVCKSKTSFVKKVYQYGLYNASTGAKVPLNAGFPIKKADGTNGYIGYWGLWSENDAIVSGDTVTRVDGTTGNYTVVQTQGKLIKHTKSTITMSSLANTKMNLYTWVGSNPSTSANYIIHWDDTSESFIVDGRESCNANGCDTNTSLVAMGISSFADLNISSWSNAWSDALQSVIPISTSYANSSTVPYYVQETIVPTSDKSFVNYGRTIINPDMNLSSDANYVTAQIDENGTNNVIGNVYTFVTANGVLVDNNRSNKPVVIPSDTNWSIASAQAYNYWQWGAQVGPLLESTSTAVTNGIYNASNFWQVNQNETVYYTWETGLNNWNKATVLKTSPGGVVVSFDQPLNINYTHTTVNDLNGDATNNGKFFTIHYDGNGLGLPWEYDTTNGWVPVINIKSGTTIGSSNQYVVKALGIGDNPALIASCTGVLNPSKDVNESFVPVSFDNNSTLIDINETVIGTTVSTTPPTDANVSVVKGVLVQ